MFFKSQFCFLDDDLWLKQRYIYMFHDDDALTLIKPVHRQGNIQYIHPAKTFHKVNTVSVQLVQSVMVVWKQKPSSHLVFAAQGVNTWWGE